MAKCFQSHTNVSRNHHPPFLSLAFLPRSRLGSDGLQGPWRPDEWQPERGRPRAGGFGVLPV